MCAAAACFVLFVVHWPLASPFAVEGWGAIYYKARFSGAGSLICQLQTLHPDLEGLKVLQLHVTFYLSLLFK